jgi:hypothetical protein
VLTGRESDPANERDRQTERSHSLVHDGHIDAVLKQLQQVLPRGFRGGRYSISLQNRQQLQVVEFQQQTARQHQHFWRMSCGVSDGKTVVPPLRNEL